MVQKSIDAAVGNHLDTHVMGTSFLDFFLPLDTLITIVLTGGYEFLMENCTSIGNYSAHVRSASIDFRCQITQRIEYAFSGFRVVRTPLEPWLAWFIRFAPVTSCLGRM